MKALQDKINFRINKAILDAIYQGDYNLCGTIVQILTTIQGLDKDGVYERFNSVIPISRDNFDAFMVLSECF